LTKFLDPLSGENDDETSNLPGAPQSAQPLSAPLIRPTPSIGDKKHYLRKLKYNEKRAAEGLDSSKRQVDELVENNRHGRAPMSHEDRLFKITKRFVGSEPTESDIQKVTIFINSKIKGKSEQTFEDCVNGLFRLDKVNFQRVKDLFLGF
jgi:hypothetical protein